MTLEISEDVKKGIEELTGLEPEVPPVEPPPVEPPPVEPPPVEPPPVEPPPVEPPPPVDDLAMPPVPSVPPVAPVPPVVPEPPPVDPRDTTIAQLQGTIEELRKMVEAVAAGKQPATPVAPVEPTAPEVHKFLEKDDDLDEALKSVDNFNAMLSGVMVKSQEGMLAALPQIVMTLADQVVTRKIAVTEFFNANKDLVGSRAYVGTVANELAAANPDWTMEQVIEKLAPEVRSRLKLGTGPGPVIPPAAPPPSADPPASPAFAGGSHARPAGGGQGELTRVEQGIMDLIKDVI
jgi:hypothetical protein